MECKNLEEPQCTTCMEAKMTRQSFKAKEENNTVKVKPGEVWSTDLGFVKELIYRISGNISDI